MLVTAHFSIEWSPEFHKKWSDALHIPKNGPLSSKFERKFYAGAGEELIRDIAIEVRKHAEEFKFNYNFRFEVVALHECGGITKFDIYADRIVTLEPDKWRETGGDVEHGDHCNECSSRGTARCNHSEGFAERGYECSDLR